MAKKYFTNVVEDYEKNIIATMCEAVENYNITAIAANNKVKFIQPTKMGVSDWTFNFIRFGFAKSAKNNPHLARLNKYVPYQDVSSTVACFLNTAVEYGFYTRKTSKKFDGGEGICIIWMD
jgi:hypothetical protein